MTKVVIMLDHVFVTVRDLDRSIAFYEKALAPLGILHTVDYDGSDGPAGHPDLKGFGRDGRVFFWLRQGEADSKAIHVGFVARNEAEVNAFYAAAMAAGAGNQWPAGGPPLLRPAILCRQHLRSRRLQHRGGLQELATPAAIVPGVALATNNLHNLVVTKLKCHEILRFRLFCRCEKSD
jgi:catechol 2,3-dioxygenase-like lactoylglutathione lyase family enzyme